MINPLFRADINGLRAWAVGLVMAYHYGVPGFGAGYIGVDVFFVLSGWLMTRLIISPGENFSLNAFYKARIRRIVPSLTVLCFILMGLGWFLLPQLDFRQLGKHAAASQLFVSNIVYFMEAGYFDPASHEKLLLHTWSLSVEWQFYIVYPLIILLIRRFLPNKMGQALIALTLASLGCSVVSQFFWPKASYLLLPSRAWQFMAGGLAYLYAEKVAARLPFRSLLPITGLGVICATACSFDTTSVWTPLWGFTTVLGTSLVLLADSQKSVLTAHPIPQAIGRWSYSIYLWHWPLYVGWRNIWHAEDMRLLVGLAFLSVLLGWGSTRWIEAPFRRKDAFTAKRLNVLIAVASVAFLIGSGVFFAQGFPSRLSSDIQQVFEDKKALEKLESYANARSNEKAGPHPYIIGNGTKAGGIALWGDSHAISLAESLDAALPEQDRAVALFALGGCPPFAVDDGNLFGLDPECVVFNSRIVDRIAKDPSVKQVVVSSYWAYYLDKAIKSGVQREKAQVYTEGITKALCSLSQAKPVFVVAPFPNFEESVPRAASYALLVHGEIKGPETPVEKYRLHNAPIYDALEAAISSCGIKLINPLPDLCLASSQSCPGVLNKIPLYIDDNHISRAVARSYVVPKILQSIGKNKEKDQALENIN